MNRHRRYLFIFIFFISAVFKSAAQNDSIRSFKNGKSLFETNCHPCHGVHREVTGPMLASIPKKREEEWLVRFIRNSQAVIISGDEYANFLFQQYHHQVMPAFPKLSYDQIKDILSFIEGESIRPTEKIDDDEILEPANGSVMKGRDIFKAQCLNCHFVRKENDYAPALGSVGKRLPKKWLFPFIRNSQKVIKGGDPYARHIFGKFKGHIMVSMEFLTDDDISAVLDYIDYAVASPNFQAGVNGRKVQEGTFAHRQTVPPIYKEWSHPFKIIFIVISLLGASVHSFVIIKLFRYLQKETPSSSII